MRLVICLILLVYSSLVFSQQEQNCEKLAIQYKGVVQADDKEQLVLDASNMLYAGHLYYYPGFVLLNETGDTIAKETVNYYGIGTNFQTHLLDIKTELQTPFKGKLLLFGSYYQTQFCEFPFQIEHTELIVPNSDEANNIIVTTNLAQDHLLIDLSNLNQNAESVAYVISITNENGQAVYNNTIDLNHELITIKKLGGKGDYYINIWDKIQQRLLPVQVVSL